MYLLVKQITLTQRQSLRFIYSVFSFSHEDNLVVFSTTIRLFRNEKGHWLDRVNFRKDYWDFWSTRGLECCQWKTYLIDNAI